MAKKIKLTVDEIVESMVSSVCETSNAEQVWRLLIDPVMHMEFKTQFNMYSSFFLTTSRSSFSTLIMGLSRISDTQNGAMNIPKLLELVEDNSNHKLIEELHNKYCKLDDIWSKIKHVRHNVYAHVSANTTEFDAFQRAGITPNDLSEAVKVSTEIVFEVYELLGNDSKNINFSHFDAMHDLKKLFNNLKAGREARLEGVKA